MVRGTRAWGQPQAQGSRKGMKKEGLLAEPSIPVFARADREVGQWGKRLHHHRRPGCACMHKAKWQRARGRRQCVRAG